jgi:hypothetical protein
VKIEKLYDQYDAAYGYFMERHYSSSSDRAHDFAIAAMISLSIKGQSEIESESQITTYYGGTNPND